MPKLISVPSFSPELKLPFADAHLTYDWYMSPQLLQYSNIRDVYSVSQYCPFNFMGILQSHSTQEAQLQVNWCALIQ